MAARLPSKPTRPSSRSATACPTTKDRLQWKWLKGAATTKAEFGDPTATTGYRLCLYDGTTTLIAERHHSGRRQLQRREPTPCWRAKGSGFRYVDRDLTPDGVQQLVLKAGAAGKAQVTLKGRGGFLDIPTLPITHLPVRVQLINSNGACLEATYGTTLSNQGDQFKAKAD